MRTYAEMTPNMIGHAGDLLPDFCGEVKQIHDRRDLSPAEAVPSGKFGAVVHHSLLEVLLALVSNGKHSAKHPLY